MRTFDSWTAFLIMLFAVVGLCGLFASYATSIPLQRGMARSVLLDRVAAEGTAPDAPLRLEGLRPALGSLAGSVLDGQGPLMERIAAARAIVQDEQQREEASLAFRTRLMLGVVTALGAVLGAGILSLARRSAGRAGSGRAGS